MRQWHQGKEGFMKVTRIQDKYNPDKVCELWEDGHIYLSSQGTASRKL